MSTPRSWSGGGGRQVDEVRWSWKVTEMGQGTDKDEKGKKGGHTMTLGGFCTSTVKHLLSYMQMLNQYVKLVLTVLSCSNKKAQLNVVINDIGCAQLCDFGLSRILDDFPSGHTTSLQVGTLQSQPLDLLDRDNTKAKWVCVCVYVCVGNLFCSPVVAGYATCAPALRVPNAHNLGL